MNNLTRRKGDEKKDIKGFTKESSNSFKVHGIKRFTMRANKSFPGKTVVSRIKAMTDKDRGDRRFTDRNRKLFKYVSGGTDAS